MAYTCQRPQFFTNAQHAIVNLHLSCEGGGNLPHRLSLIRASAAAVCRRASGIRPYATVSDNRAYLVVDADKLCVGSSSIKTDNVLRAQSRDLSSLIRNLLLIERIETRLDSSCLIVELVAESCHRVGDVSAVGSNLLADVVQTCESLTGLNTLLEACRTVTVLSGYSIPCREAVTSTPSKPSGTAGTTCPVSKSAADYGRQTHTPSGVTAIRIIVTHFLPHFQVLLFYRWNRCTFWLFRRSPRRLFRTSCNLHARDPFWSCTGLGFSLKQSGFPAHLHESGHYFVMELLYFLYCAVPSSPLSEGVCNVYNGITGAIGCGYLCLVILEAHA